MEIPTITITDPTPEADFARALGIGTKRMAELNDIINMQYVVKQANDLEAVVAISEHLNTINELAFAMLMYGVALGRMEQEEEMMTKLLS